MHLLNRGPCRDAATWGFAAGLALSGGGPLSAITGPARKWFPGAAARGGSRETLIFAKLVFPGKTGPGNQGAALTWVLWCIGA